MSAFASLWVRGDDIAGHGESSMSSQGGWARAGRKSGWQREKIWTVSCLYKWFGRGLKWVQEEFTQRWGFDFGATVGGYKINWGKVKFMNTEQRASWDAGYLYFLSSASVYCCQNTCPNFKPVNMLRCLLLSYWDREIISRFHITLFLPKLLFLNWKLSSQIQSAEVNTQISKPILVFSSFIPFNLYLATTQFGKS